MCKMVVDFQGYTLPETKIALKNGDWETIFLFGRSILGGNFLVSIGNMIQYNGGTSGTVLGIDYNFIAVLWQTLPRCSM